MTKATSHKQPWTKGEKFLLGAILLAVTLAVLGRLWWHRVSDEPVVSIPTPTMPTPNAYTYFQSAAAQTQDDLKVAYAIHPWNPHLPDPPKNDPAYHYYSPADKAALVQENATALKTLRQGLAYPCRYPPVRSFNAPFSGYARLRLLARLLVLEGQVRQEQGDWSGAVNSSLDGIEMGEDVPRGGVVITMLVGLACQSIASRPLWGEVDHLNAAQAKAAARRMEKITSRHIPFADVVQEEEWAGEAELLEIFRDPRWRGSWKDMITAGNSNGIGWTRPQQVQMQFISKKTIMQNYRAYMDQVVQAAHQPYAAPTQMTITPGDPLTQVLAGIGYRKAWSKDVEIQSQNAHLMVTLALRAYKMEHGAYPASLTALTPNYLSRVPDDPFALSGPVRYKRQGSKYIFYSVGPTARTTAASPSLTAASPHRPKAPNVITVTGWIRGT